MSSSRDDEPRPVSDEWLDQLTALIANAPINLVSRRDRAHVRSRHVDECVAVANVLRIRPGARWMDLGTGGGLPGLVLAAAFPEVSWTLLDARRKKLGQVQHFVAALGLANVEVLHGRAEQLANDLALRGGFDGVISRAVGSLEDTVGLARGFLRPGGEVIAIRGRSVHEEVASAWSTLPGLGLSIEAVEQISGTIRSTWLVRLRGRSGPHGSTSSA